MLSSAFFGPAPMFGLLVLRWVQIAMPAEQKDQAAQQELEAVKEQMRYVHSPFVCLRCSFTFAVARSKRDEEMQQLRDELEKAKNRPTQNNSRSCSIL